MRKFALFNTAAVLAGVALVALLTGWGESLYPVLTAMRPAGAAQAAATGLHQPLTLLLLQMTVVIGAARVLGPLFRRLGQPAVVGEIFAGILLGPSLLGLLWPQGLALLFPPASLGALQLLAQLGVLLFMFAVGLDLDPAEWRRQARPALVISQAGIALPFLLGLGLALTCFPRLAPAGVSFPAFALFLGIALSVTAFPVLARILEDRRLTHTPIGRLALASAALGDVSAWCLLALVVALAHGATPDANGGGLGGAGLTVALALGLVAVLHGVVRPMLRRALATPLAQARPESASVVLALLLLLPCAAFAEAIGIHALFGAFLAGTALPAPPAWREPLRQRLLGFSSAGLLPLFFALTGLRTQLGLLQGAQDWLLCGLIIVLAVAGKAGGTVAAARLLGHGWRQSLTLGALMNTRGLVELIVLNVGYDLGILSARVFTMLVIMALFTTCLTGLLLRLLRAGAVLPAAKGGELSKS